MKINQKFRNQLNELASRYTGLRHPSEMGEFYERVQQEFDVVIDMFTLVNGRASVVYSVDGDEVENSLFVYSVYEPSEGVKNDYNFYFS